MPVFASIIECLRQSAGIFSGIPQKYMYFRARRLHRARGHPHFYCE